jgi:hypothetical protein
MGNLSTTIDWLCRQLKNTEQAIDDIKKGLKIEASGRDATEPWLLTLERLAARYRKLIADYEKRNRI